VERTCWRDLSDFLYRHSLVSVPALQNFRLVQNLARRVGRLFCEALDDAMAITLFVSLLATHFDFFIDGFVPSGTMLLWQWGNEL